MRRGGAQLTIMGRAPRWLHSAQLQHQRERDSQGGRLLQEAVATPYEQKVYNIERQT